MEANDQWDPTTVKKVLTKMNEIRAPLSWTPLLEPVMQEWEAMIAGAAMAAGLEIDHTLRAVKDVVQDAEERGA